MWIVMVKKHTEQGFLVWLREVRELTSGALISTGRRTPKYIFSLSRGNYETTADSLRRAVAVLTAESVLAEDEESLMISAEIAEQLADLLVPGEVT